MSARAYDDLLVQKERVENIHVAKAIRAMIPQYTARECSLVVFGEACSRGKKRDGDSWRTSCKYRRDDRLTEESWQHQTIVKPKEGAKQKQNWRNCQRMSNVMARGARRWSKRRLGHVWITWKSLKRGGGHSKGSREQSGAEATER